MNKPPVALQLWSLHNECRKDFASTVMSVAKLGYEGVELAGYGGLDAVSAAVAIGKSRLKVSGMHIGLPRLREELANVILEARLFGASSVICPSWPVAEYATAEGCRKVGGELNALGARLRKEEIRFSFHNHAPEFAIVGGRRVFDWILDEAEPANLGCELDVYWAQVGGKNPVDFIREQGRRIGVIHLKDETELGLGPVNFANVFAAADEIGAVEWYVVEQEKFNHPPIESVRLCLEQLRSWGRVTARANS